jgi:trehalose/maltose transport system permease protein
MNALPSSRTGGLAALRVRHALWMLAPLLVLLAGVAGWPLLRTIWISLTDMQLSDPAAAR